MPGEGRGLSSRQTQQAVRDRRLGNLSTPPSVQKLQMALHAKAKSEAGYRFYALYDKITHDRSQGSTARHPAGLAHLTTASQSVHAPVRVGLEAARSGAKPWQSNRDLRRR